MNRTLENDIFFIFVTSGKITELRTAGDRLILYTESNELYQKAKDWKQVLQLAPYYSGKDFIGVDIYFPREHKKALLRALVKWQSGVLKERVSAR